MVSIQVHGKVHRKGTEVSDFGQANPRAAQALTRAAKAVSRRSGLPPQSKWPGAFANGPRTLVRLSVKRPGPVGLTGSQWASPEWPNFNSANFTENVRFRHKVAVKFGRWDKL
jgi:hypothetical protein